jgi:hypothetical protein
MERYLQNDRITLILKNSYFLSSLSIAEHGDESAHTEIELDEIQFWKGYNLGAEASKKSEDSDSDNGEFITIKVTNTDLKVEKIGEPSKPR